MVHGDRCPWIGRQRLARKTLQSSTIIDPALKTTMIAIS